MLGLPVHKWIPINITWPAAGQPQLRRLHFDGEHHLRTSFILPLLRSRNYNIIIQTVPILPMAVLENVIFHVFVFSFEAMNSPVV